MAQSLCSLTHCSALSLLSSKQSPCTQWNSSLCLTTRATVGSRASLTGLSVVRSSSSVPLRGIVMATQAAEPPAAARDGLKQLKPVLYDVPVSNNGARVRFVIYGKGLEDEIALEKPGALGGSESETFLKLNPQGLLPTMALPDGSGLFEGEIISEYLLDKYSDVGPSYIPDTVEERTVAKLLKRVLDTYIAPNQGAMYRDMPGEEREAKLAIINKQLDVLEKIILAKPFAAGAQLSSADFALYPTFVFLTFILPRAFNWEDVFKGRPKLKSWWDAMSELPLTHRILDEMEPALKSWDEAGRWEERGITDQVTSGKYKLTY